MYHRIIISLFTTATGLFSPTGAFGQFPPILDLLDLPAEDGIVFLGAYATCIYGHPLQAGDLNDDGFKDIILSAYACGSGRVYVVFGGPTLQGRTLVDLATLGAPDGFVIQGPSAGSEFGESMIAGVDFNADGIDDLAVGADAAEPPGGNDNGQVFVIFGRAGLGSSGTFDLSTLDGTNGFVINGRDRSGFLGDNTGPLIAVDFNDDGYPDLAVVAWGANAPGRPGAGQAYIIFGGPGMGASGVINVADLDGTNGITINGLHAGWGFGILRFAGDLNDDGLGDLAFGVIRESLPGRPEAGAVYVLLGGSEPGPGGFIDLAEVPGRYGYVVYGPIPYAWVGDPHALGDASGDGVDDLLITGQGFENFVVCGGPNVGASGLVDLAVIDPPYGFVMWASFPLAVRAMGDVNADGLADFGLVWPGNPEGRIAAGGADILYGSPSMGAEGWYVWPPGGPTGPDGFRIWGAHENDQLWPREGLPDVNGDGIPELTLSARLRRPDGTRGGGR